MSKTLKQWKNVCLTFKQWKNVLQTLRSIHWQSLKDSAADNTALAISPHMKLPNIWMGKLSYLKPSIFVIIVHLPSGKLFIPIFSKFNASSSPHLMKQREQTSIKVYDSIKVYVQKCIVCVEKGRWTWIWRAWWCCFPVRQHILLWYSFQASYYGNILCSSGRWGGLLISGD